MFGRKAARIAQLEAACEEWAKVCDTYAESKRELAQRAFDAEAELGRRNAHEHRTEFANAMTHVLAAFGADGEVNELDLRRTLDDLDDGTLTSLVVRMGTAHPRLVVEVERRQS